MLEPLAGFMVRFGICNLILSGIIGLLFGIKWLFRGFLSNRMQYNLCLILLGLLTVPFLPFSLNSYLSGMEQAVFPILPSTSGIDSAVSQPLTHTTDWMNDFALSVNDQISPTISLLFFGIWILGILFMVFLLFRSAIQLHRIEQSALSLQNPLIYRLYEECLHKLNISKEIPVYSTAFFKSPMIVGFWRPRIYLPIHLISDHNTVIRNDDIRYMLLHELQHYKHKDSLIGCLMNLVSIVYWFHPFVWFALKEMRNERELACTSFPFTSGLGGNRKQMKRRILNIASYQRPDRIHRLKSTLVFTLTSVLLIGFVPFIFTTAADDDRYQ